MLARDQLILDVRQIHREKNNNVINCNFEKDEIINSINTRKHMDYPSDFTYGSGNASIKFNSYFRKINNVKIQKEFGTL